MKASLKFAPSAFLLVSTLLVLASATRADIFVTNNTDGIIDTFNFATGASTHPGLISGLSSPYSIAISGSNLFVANSGTGTIGEYTLSGTVINASLISGLHNPTGLAISGSNIFVTNLGAGTVGEYTTSGTTVNANLVTGLNEPIGVAVSGGNLFVSDYQNGGQNSGLVAEYTTAGVTVNSSLIIDLTGPIGLLIHGTNLYVANEGIGTIGEYSITNGATVNASLITGLNHPYYLASDGGTDLYVANYAQNVAGAGSIGEYTLTGGAINAAFISGLNAPVGVGVVAPEPSTVHLLIGAAFLFPLLRRRRAHA